MLLPLAAASVAVLTSCDEESSGGLIEGDGWRGALMATPERDAFALPDGTVVDAESRVPRRADVERFEEALPPTGKFTGVPDSPETVELDEGYVRQYTELVAEGERRLLVQGICDPDGYPEWESRWLVVADGGSCFWEALMDAESGEILRFGFHGMG